MPSKVDQVPIHGTVEPGFEEVESEFKKNFLERGELGAACAIYHEGEKVVDLWGGYRDRTTSDPWQEDTLVLVFSTTKGISALTVAAANSRGLLDYDEKVAAYWPEFAQGGKEGITVRQLLAHQAGLCALDEPLSPAVFADLDRLARLLAKQRPAWKPGTKHGYHYLSLGAYENELIRRVDPQHRSLGRFFQQEIAAPLGLEFYIGLPPEVSDSKIAPIEAFSAMRMLLHINTLPVGMLLGYINPLSLTYQTLNNPKLTSPGDLDGPAYRAVELPSAGGIGQVRAVAKAYGVFATGASELDLGRDTLEELAKPAVPPPAGAHDEVMRVDMSYSLGFFRPSTAFRFGSDQAFGTMGAGGSFGFADPEARVGFAYAPNKMGFHIWDDPREKALRDALGRCLAR
jgi:CubicO group peptidase (beta-lactamase class C family)